MHSVLPNVPPSQPLSQPPSNPSPTYAMRRCNYSLLRLRLRLQAGPAQGLRGDLPTHPPTRPPTPSCRCNYSLLLYGFGSKRGLLKAFGETLQDGLGVVVVNGYNPHVTAKQVRRKEDYALWLIQRKAGERRERERGGRHNTFDSGDKLCIIPVHHHSKAGELLLMYLP